MESNVLRFVARFDTTRPIDVDRRFIVSYFLSDDTLSVFEPLQRNSGKSGQHTIVPHTKLDVPIKLVRSGIYVFVVLCKGWMDVLSLY